MSTSIVYQSASPEADAIAVLMERVRAKSSQALGGWTLLGKDAADFLLKEASDSATDCLLAYESFFQLSGLQCPDLKQNLVWYDCLWRAGLFIPVMKWAHAWPIADLSGLEGPAGVQYREYPEPPPLFDGLVVDPLVVIFPYSPVARSHLRTRIRERSKDGPTRRSLRLSWSLNSLKDSMPGMWPGEVSVQLEKHKKCLSSQPPKLSRGAHTVLRSVASSLMRRALGSRSYVRYDDLPAARLSASAGFVKFYDHETQKFISSQGTRAAQFHQLGGFGSRELSHMVYDPRKGRTTSVYQHPYQFDWRDWDFDSKVQVVALQEPFKIRTISVADGPSTAAGSRIQRFLHGCMRQIPAFRLIGGVETSELVSSLPPLPDGWGYVSGDYSSATDLLSAEASRVVFDSLMAYIQTPRELRRRLSEGLFSAHVDYTKTLDQLVKGWPESYARAITVPETFQQTNGQLMGNILSFPILCLVNLSALLLSVARAGDPKHHLYVYACQALSGSDTLFESDANWESVLVNGDDIAFQASTELYGVWRKTIKQFGLQLSVGKNFFSPSFMTINSELFVLDARFRPSPDELVKLERPWWGGLQPDILRHRKSLLRLFGVDILTADPRLVLPSIQERFLSRIPGKVDLANRLWFQRIRQSGFLDPYKGLNWFIPVAYGGMGLNPVGLSLGETTYAQRALAVRMALYRDDSGRKPHLGSEGKLISRDARLAFNSVMPTRRVTGQLVTSRGRSYVLTGLRSSGQQGPPQEHESVEDEEVLAYETFDSFEQNDTRVFTWLDYHVDGLTYDTDRIKRRVTALLHWGLRIKESTVDKYFHSLDKRPVYRVVDRLVRLREEDIETCKSPNVMVAAPSAVVH